MTTNQFRKLISVIIDEITNKWLQEI